MNTVRTRELRVGGLRTVLREAGPEDDTEAVVFVHGNPGPSADWTRLLGAVGPFCRAVAWDQPGFGQADKPRDFLHTIDGHTEFIDRAINELGVERAHLVVHDFGGAWGLSWAADHPDRVASVVLINTGVLLGYRWHWLARIWQTPLLGELFTATTTRAAMRAVLKRSDPGLSREAVDRIHNANRASRRAVFRLYRASKQRVIDRRTPQLAERLRPLDLPAQVVWGARDAYIPVRYASLQQEVFPRAEVTELPDSGHWPFLDDPAAVERLVIPFLRGQVHPETAQRTTPSRH